MNNFLLDTEGTKEYIAAEIERYSNSNDGTVEGVIVWDAFKAYLKGVVISLKVYRDKVKQLESWIWFIKLIPCQNTWWKSADYGILETPGCVSNLKKGDVH